MVLHWIIGEDSSICTISYHEEDVQFWNAFSLSLHRLYFATNLFYVALQAFHFFLHTLIVDITPNTLKGQLYRLLNGDRYERDNLFFVFFSLSRQCMRIPKQNIGSEFCYTGQLNSI